MSTRSAAGSPPPIPSLLYTVLIQAIAMAGGAAAGQRLGLGIWGIALTGGVAAAALARIVKLSGPWITINFALPIGAIAIILHQVPSALIAGVTIATILLYVPTIWTRVPYYPTPREIYDAIDERVPDRGTFADLGCGFGDLLLHLARRHPEARFVGFEISPLACYAAKLRVLFGRYPNVEIRFKSFWSASLAEFDVVYAFLSPTPMAALWEKVEREMKPGSLFLSNSFEPPATPAEVREFRAERSFKLLYFPR